MRWLPLKCWFDPCRYPGLTDRGGLSGECFISFKEVDVVCRKAVGGEIRDASATSGKDESRTRCIWS